MKQMKVIEKIEKKINVNKISLEILSTLLNILLKDNYIFNSSLEIQKAIKKEFNLEIDMDSIENLFTLNREMEEIKIQCKNLNLYQ
jgi:hypothetical protein